MMILGNIQESSCLRYVCAAGHLVGARHAVPLRSLGRFRFIQLREPFAQFVELRLPLGERRFEPLHDMFRRAAAKRLVFQALLLRRDVFRKPFEFLAQARDFRRARRRRRRTR